MVELYEPSSRVDGDFKSSVDKLIPICDLLPREKSESVGYGVVRPYE